MRIEPKILSSPAPPVAVSLPPFKNIASFCAVPVATSSSGPKFIKLKSLSFGGLSGALLFSASASSSPT
jgi:hypothetical protein